MDGDKGLVYAKTSKIVSCCSKVTALSVSCRWSGEVYIAMFRRPMLCGLNQLWRSIVEFEELPKGARRPLKREVAHELARCVGLLPLAVMNLRTSADSRVTASDASTTGGGVCVSRGLTRYGVTVSAGAVRGDLPEAHDFIQVLSIGPFDGISALRVALDALGLPVAGHISVEKFADARRVVESYFPDTWYVELVTEELVEQRALRYSSAGVVIVGAGPPCQGVSGLNSDRRGALRGYRSCLFTHVPRVTKLVKKTFVWAQVQSGNPIGIRWTTTNSRGGPTIWQGRGLPVS